VSESLTREDTVAGQGTVIAGNEHLAVYRSAIVYIKCLGGAEGNPAGIMLSRAEVNHIGISRIRFVRIRTTGKQEKVVETVAVKFDGNLAPFVCGQRQFQGIVSYGNSHYAIT
jgi:hypothetical protein